MKLYGRFVKSDGTTSDTYEVVDHPMGSRLVVARWVARSLKRKITGPDDDGFIIQELLDELVAIGWTPPGACAHDEFCCQEHGTHSMPHKRCILR